MSAKTFLNGRVTLHAGDCLEVIQTLPDASVDSVVTDPPYALTANKRGGTGAASVNLNSPAGRARITAGFMGKVWDTGEVAFAVGFWAEVYRVLKPGGYVLAFGGTRTIHRLTCAIEDAGFEIRDMIAWLYGSGFPKSHDVAKGIDRAAGVEREITRLGQTKSPDLAGQFDLASSGLRQRRDEPATDAARQWDGWGTALKPALEPITVGRKPLAGTVAENVLAHGTGAINIRGCRIPSLTGQRPNGDVSWDSEQFLCSSCAELAGSTTKPEALARKASSATKPAGQTLSEKAQLNHLDTSKPDTGCSGGMTAGGIATSLSTAEFGKPHTEPCPLDTTSTTSTATRATTGSKICSACSASIMPSSTGSTTAEKKNSQPGESKPVLTEQGSALGRWPSNLIHDGSDEVLAAFPETTSGTLTPEMDVKASTGWSGGSRADRVKNSFTANAGSAARFFYNTKADSDDRIGSKHPTVKPVDLMRYLVRLITPPGGTVLDPFAGTGTTGEAAFYEGFRSVLIEREEEYRADIARRMALAMAGPDERKREIAKAKAKPDSFAGTLFAEAAE